VFVEIGQLSFVVQFYISVLLVVEICQLLPNVVRVYASVLFTVETGMFLYCTTLQMFSLDRLIV